MVWLQTVSVVVARIDRYWFWIRHSLENKFNYSSPYSSQGKNWFSDEHWSSPCEEYGGHCLLHGAVIDFNWIVICLSLGYLYHFWPELIAVTFFECLFSVFCRPITASRNHHLVFFRRYAHKSLETGRLMHFFFSLFSIFLVFHFMLMLISLVAKITTSVWLR